jgi:hypothetical protein
VSDAVRKIKGMCQSRKKDLKTTVEQKDYGLEYVKNAHNATVKTKQSS